MKKHEVPQDDGIFADKPLAAYALDEAGRYVLVPTAGWEPANVAVANRDAALGERIEQARRAAASGLTSPLGYFMVLHQMNAAILSRCSGVARWRVRRHLRPEIFRKLPRHVKERYARAFEVTLDQLLALDAPEDPKK